jgi:integrative and conjugative element protein (TIGR02256 family)
MSSTVAGRTSSGVIVAIHASVLSTIRRYSLPAEHATEAGGIFIGAYRSRHIEIVSCTVPMADDTRRRFSFDRVDHRHQAAALSAWRESGHTLTFVGEWHSHPEAAPSPSWVDRRAWTKVMKRRPSSAHFFMIQGWISAWCAVGLRGQLLKVDLEVDGSNVPFATRHGGIMMSSTDVQS